LTSFPGEFLSGIYSGIRFEDEDDIGFNSFIVFYSRKMIRWNDGSNIRVSEKTKVIAY